MGKKEFKVNHLLFMDELKLFRKNDDQIDSIVNTVYVFSEDTGMEFGLKKCGVVIMKRGILGRFYGTHMPNGDVMKQVDENGYMYLGALELDEIKENELKEKVITKFKRR